VYPPKIGYVIPDTLEEAMEFLENHEDARPLAGGHSLIPALKLRIIRPSYLVEIRRFKELNYVKKEGNIYKIGALTTHYDIIRANIPLLSETATTIGDPQVRNMGTIGGSLANADPSADYPAVVLAYEANLRLVSSKGERVVNVKDFFKGPFTTELREDELLYEIEFPKLEGYKYKYSKVVRRAGDFALVGMAVLAKVDGEIKDIRVSYTGVSDKPFRPFELEKTIIGSKPSLELINKFAEQVITLVKPPSDSRGSSEYRRKVMRILTINTLKEVLGVVS